jgi:uncharacterized protein (TIGR03118 family)
MILEARDDVGEIGKRVDAARLARRDERIEPWGLAMAPSDFGPASNHLIVGNFGNGTLLAIDPTSGRPAGLLLKTDGKALIVEGLWGLEFGNGQSVGQSNALFFTAGPNQEMHGLFGRINVVSTPVQ